MNCSCTANKIVRAMGVAAGITLVASSALAGATAAERTASKAPTMTTNNVVTGSVRFNASSLDAYRPAGVAINRVGVPAGVDGVACDGDPEGEVCAIPIPDDTFNGGCNSTPNVFSALSLGQVISGSTGDDGASRDTDWYEITLPAGTYSVLLEAGGQAAWGFVGTAGGPLANPTCGAITEINPVATGSAGAATATLTGGVYWVFVSTLGFDNQGCFDYCLQVADAAGLSGACCVEGACVEGQSPIDCDALGGSFQGDGTVCANVECPQIFCGGPGTGDCCAANGTPFCDDAACCAAICAFDPFCCDTSWDGICAGAAQTDCAVCNLPAACCFPEAVCQELSQNDCIDFGGIFQGGGTTCAGTECPNVSAPGNQSCEDAQAITGADVNGPAIEGSNFFATPEFGLPACGGPLTGPAVWYSYDAGALGSQTLTVSTCATAGGGGGGSDCCFANGTPGCDDPDCQALVCGADPFCCETEWDGLCAGDAQDNCAVCDVPGGPGNVNPDTVLNVFTNTIPTFCLGTFCCVTGNDDACGLYSEVTFCADATNNDGVYFIVVSGFAGATGDFLLTVSGDGVECGGGDLCISCEAGDALEGEPCPTGVDEFNGGCNSTPNVFSSLNLDEWVCGTADAGGGTRDTDWYVINIPVDGTYDFVLQAAFEAVGGFIGNATGPVVNPTCAAISQINPFITPATCTEGAVTASLTAGTYWVFVAPLNFEGVDCPDSGECPGNGQYRMQVRTGVPIIPCEIDCPAGALVECQDCEDFEGGGGGQGDCCSANGTPGCNDATCEALICGQDPFCCNTEWDQICANAALAQCDVCGGGGGSDCCTPGGNGTPGCDDAACEALICGQDPFCCDNTWDGLCATAANEQCAVCQGGLVLGEPVDEDCNGGCNNEIAPSFDSIECGDTVCGTITAGFGQRDTDWFLVEVTNPDGAVITATLEAEFAGVVFIIDVPDCGNIAILGETGFSSCDQGIISGQPAVASVGPGTYVVFVSAGNPDGSGVFEGITCGNNANYVLTVDGDCGGAVCPCVADLNGDCVVNAADLGILLNNFGCTGAACVADINDDNTVNAADLGILLNNFGCEG